MLNKFLLNSFLFIIFSLILPFAHAMDKDNSIDPQKLTVSAREPEEVVLLEENVLTLTVGQLKKCWNNNGILKTMLGECVIIEHPERPHQNLTTKTYLLNKTPDETKYTAGRSPEDYNDYCFFFFSGSYGDISKPYTFIVSFSPGKVEAFKKAKAN